MKNEKWHLERKKKVNILSSEQILDMLISGDVKVIHRVSKNGYNYKAICNEPYFDGLIDKAIEYLNRESIKYGQSGSTNSNSEPTPENFSNLGDLSSKIGEQLNQAQTLLDINTKLNSLRKIKAEMLTKRKRIIDLEKVGRTADEEELHPDDQNEYVNRTSIIKQLGAFLSIFKSRAIVRIALLGAFGYLCFLGYQKYVAYQGQRQAKLIQNDLDRAREAMATGQYDRAIQFYANIKDPDLIPTEDLLKMADAYQIKKNSADARKTISHLENRSLNSKQKSNIEHLKGMASLNENNLNAAIKHLSNAAQSNESFLNVFNLGVLNAEAGNNLEAESNLIKALQMPDSDRSATLISLYGPALELDLQQFSEMKQSLSKPGTRVFDEPFTRLKKIYLLIDKENSRRHPWLDETLAVQSMIAGILNRTDDLIAVSQKWMELNPKDLPAKPLRQQLRYELTFWSNLYELCSKAYQLPTASKLKGLFYSPCVEKIKGPLSAISYAQYALKIRPELASLRGYLADLVLKTGNSAGAMQILREGDITDSAIAQRTVKRLCQNEPSPKKCLAQFNQ